MSARGDDEDDYTNGEPDEDEIARTAPRSERERRYQRPDKRGQPNVRNTAGLPLEAGFRRRELRRTRGVVGDDVA